MATDFILKAMKWVDDGGDLQDIIKQTLNEYRCVFGYGRPILQIDERIPHFMKKLKSFDMDKGKHVLLVFKVEEILLGNRIKFHLNYGGLVSAVAADMNFTPRQFYLFCVPMFIAGMMPCSIDSMEKCEGTFFPLRCSAIADEMDVVSRSWNG